MISSVFINGFCPKWFQVIIMIHLHDFPPDWPLLYPFWSWFLGHKNKQWPKVVQVGRCPSKHVSSETGLGMNGLLSISIPSRCQDGNKSDRETTDGTCVVRCGSMKTNGNSVIQPVQIRRKMEVTLYILRDVVLRGKSLNRPDAHSLNQCGKRGKPRTALHFQKLSKLVWPFQQIAEENKSCQKDHVKINCNNK